MRINLDEAVRLSLQTPTKQNTQWRSNLSTVICGQLQGRSNDAPALGLADAMRRVEIEYLPSCARWAALGGPGYAYDDHLEALWRAGQRAVRAAYVRQCRGSLHDPDWRG